MEKNLAIQEEIVFYAKLLEQKGLVNPLEGNISILDRETGYFYITPSGTRKSFLEPNMVAVLKDGEEVMKIYFLAKSMGEVADISEFDWETMCGAHPGSRRNRYTAIKAKQ